MKTSRKATGKKRLSQIRNRSTQRTSSDDERATKARLTQDEHLEESQLSFSKQKSKKPGKKSEVESQTGSDNSSSTPWWKSPFALMTFGGLLAWLSFPPVGLWPLAVLAPIPWLMLIAQPKLTGRRPALQIYMGSWLHWIMLLYYIRIPHWLLNFGWLVMSAYLCIYLALFVGIARHAVHRWKLPLLIAAPLTYCGLEILRSYLFGGFAMQLWGHTLAKQTIAIQVADLFGGYGLSLLLILAATSIYQVATTWKTDRKRMAIAALTLVATISGTLGYGAWRLSEPTTTPDRQPIRIALIQGSVDTTFPATREEYDRIKKDTFFNYQDLTVKALQSHDDIDVVAWPEGKFTVGPDYLIPDDISGFSQDQQSMLLRHQREFPWAALQATWPDELPKPGSPTSIKQRPIFITSCATVDLNTELIYNTALEFDRNGNLVTRYNKNHLVMFGEFFPLSDWFPFLRELTPIGQGFESGDDPVAFEAGEYTLSPSICFESTVPHVMRRHVNRLASEGNPADTLINLSDDGWFYGAAALDHHLACNIFRSVELRVPNLVAANTGFSADIDNSGKVRQLGPRRDEGVIVAELNPSERTSLYRLWGDIPLGLTSLFAIAGCFSLIFSKRKSSKKSSDGSVVDD